MRKLLKRIAIMVIILLAGYTIIVSEFGQNVLLPRLAELIPIEELQQNEENSEIASASDLPSTREEGSPQETPEMTPGPYIAPPEDVDDTLIRSTTLQLTNNLRSEQGVGALSENDRLIAAANIRAVEIAESFSHTRPSGEEFYTVLAEEEVQYKYWLAGENLAMGTYHMEDANMAEFLFDGWVESPGHYENMIEPDYQEIGIGVYYDGEYLYLVQIFGTSF